MIIVMKIMISLRPPGAAQRLRGECDVSATVQIIATQMQVIFGMMLQRKRLQNGPFFKDNDDDHHHNHNDGDAIEDI